MSAWLRNAGVYMRQTIGVVHDLGSIAALARLSHHHQLVAVAGLLRPLGEARGPVEADGKQVAAEIVHVLLSYCAPRWSGLAAIAFTCSIAAALSSAAGILPIGRFRLRSATGCTA
jgi:hypothetical protein